MYIIDHNQKLILELKIEEENFLEEEEEAALDNIINSDIDDFDDIGNANIDDLTIEQISNIYLASKILQNLSGLDVNKLLLYWLKKKDIEVKIGSEIDIKELQNEGYSVFTLA